MEGDVGMGSQPGLVFLVNAIVVQNHMDFLAMRKVADNLIHKLQELDATLLGGDLVRIAPVETSKAANKFKVP